MHLHIQSFLFVVPQRLKTNFTLNNVGTCINQFNNALFGKIIFHGIFFFWLCFTVNSLTTFNGFTRKNPLINVQHCYVVWRTERKKHWFLHVHLGCPALSFQEQKKGLREGRGGTLMISCNDDQWEEGVGEPLRPSALENWSHTSFTQSKAPMKLQ